MSEEKASLGKQLKLTKPEPGEPISPSLRHGPNNIYSFPGGPQAYYSDPERFVPPEEAIKILSRFFPPAIARSFLLTEVEAGRIGVVGLPWVILRTPCYPVDSEEGRKLLEEERLRHSGRGLYIRSTSIDGKWVHGEIEEEDDCREYGRVKARDINLDAGDVCLDDEFHDYGDWGESVSIYTDHIRFSRSTLERYVSDSPEPAPPPPEPIPTEQVKPKRKPGRKPLPINDKVWAELCRRAYRGEFESDGPIIQAEACRRMLDWLSEQGEDMPEETMRYKIQMLWNTLGCVNSPHFPHYHPDLSKIGS